MLEEIKEVLIKEKKDELERKKKIDNEIKKTLLEIDENVFPDKSCHPAVLRNH